MQFSSLALGLLGMPEVEMPSKVQLQQAFSLSDGVQVSPTKA